MATAPQVQTLAQIMAELEPATSKQTSLIQAKQAGLGAKYEGEQKALDAIKAQSMNTINTQATGRGMAFSGIPLDEQATYLSTEYMPSVAKLKTAQTEESTGLEKELADIYSQNYQTAFGTRTNQQSALNNWNLQMMQQEAAAAEAEKNRQFEAQQNALNRAAQAANSAGSAGGLDSAMTPDEAADAVIFDALRKNIPITPQIFQMARTVYARAGGSTGQFATDYWRYVPEGQRKSNWQAYYYATGKKEK